LAGYFRAATQAVQQNSIQWAHRRFLCFKPPIATPQSIGIPKEKCKKIVEYFLSLARKSHISLSKRGMRSSLFTSSSKIREIWENGHLARLSFFLMR
jgi:hypothetical protein